MARRLYLKKNTKLNKTKLNKKKMGFHHTVEEFYGWKVENNNIVSFYLKQKLGDLASECTCIDNEEESKDNKKRLIEKSSKSKSTVEEIKETNCKCKCEKFRSFKNTEGQLDRYCDYCDNIGIDQDKYGHVLFCLELEELYECDFFEKNSSNFELREEERVDGGGNTVHHIFYIGLTDVVDNFKDYKKTESYRNIQNKLVKHGLIERIVDARKINTFNYC